MGVKENKELVRRFFIPLDEKFHREALKAENPRAVLENKVRKDFNEFLTPDFKVHSTFGDASFEEYLQTNVSTCLAIPDVTFSIDDMVAEGDKIMIRFTTRGTLEGTMPGPPGMGNIGGTGNKLNYAGVYTCRFAKGKIAEVWALYDTLTMMQQLGVMPKL
jgi:predicted ester cyclase